MLHISGDLNVNDFGNHMISWDVLKDTDVLEGNIDFYISIEKEEFIIKEELPIYPGCEEFSEKEKKTCMGKKIGELVSNNLNTKIEGVFKLKIYFKISKGGFIKNLVVKTSNLELEEEVIRVLKLLPQIIPGKQRGLPIEVGYVFPLTLSL